MPPPTFLTITEQVAEFLKGGVRRGRWGEQMPGTRALCAELGVNQKTVEAALQQLEQEGVLMNQGARRARRICLAPVADGPKPLRIAILHHEMIDQVLVHMVHLVHRLEDAGHEVTIAPKGLIEMRMDVRRVARVVRSMDADAWVVGSGSREVLEWFAAQPVPAFALFGHRAGLPIAAAGPDKIAAYAEVARQFHQQGHRRIVLLARKVRRVPEPGAPETAFLDELRSLGHRVSAYNLPDWDDHQEGFQRLLESLFKLTPPTALFVDEGFQLVAVMQFLAKRGIRVPEDISLACAEPGLSFAWCDPPVAHIRWDYRPVVTCVQRWARGVGRGKPDLRQTLTRAEFLPGGTIGVATG